MARMCDRCKDPTKQIGLLLEDRKEHTEIDLCVECKNEFQTFLNPQAKRPEEVSIKAPAEGRKKP